MLAASLTLSPFMMSVSQLLLLLVWLFMGDPVKVKLGRFFHDKIAILLVSLYLLHVVGLVYTSDFAYAFKDLRVKLPLLILPLVLSTVKPLPKKYFDLLLLVYVASIFVASCFSFGIWLRHDYGDVREISRFVSHIRFCLNIVLVIGIMAYYLYTRPEPWWERLLQGILILWFLFQLHILESISGYLALAGMVAGTLLYVYFTVIRKALWRVLAIVVMVGIPLVAAIWLCHMVRPMMATPKVDFETLDKKTSLGNDYWHDTVCFPAENGRYVGLYFCRPEMREAWNRRSQLDYDGQTLNGEILEATLARYLTSKDLRKDADGVAALTDDDIRCVEQGIANYENWSHPGLRSRLSATVFEYQQYRRHNNPNGGSLSQRIEYTRASLYLIGKHPVFGVGTGDIPNAYQQAYDELDSPLQPEFRHKAHNQYLSITVGFGIIGLAIFLFILLYPFCSSGRYRTYLYTIFLIILLLSMLPEDTIESQAGVTWFAFFNSLLIFALGNREENLQKR